MALGGPAELLRAIQARNAASPYESLNLTAARSTVWRRLRALLLFATVDDDGFWNMGRGGVITMLAQLLTIEGDSSPSEAPLSEHGARRAGLAERPEKSVLSGRKDLGSREISCVGELSCSLAWLSELTPAHVPRREPEPICDERH